MNFFSHLFPVPPNFLPDVIDVASDRKKVSTLLEYVALASKTAEEQQVYFTGPLGLLENQGVQQAESNLEVKDISLSFKRKPSGKSPAVFMLPIIDICQKLRIIVFDICRKGGIMPRPIRCRRIERLPVYRSFSPDDITAAESVQMTVDEFEALRLLDDEGLTQEACAARMNIARTTVTSIYDSSRKKVADALVHGKRLLITGGRCEFAPVEIKQHIMEKGSSTMRIAVTYENGEIFQHFGHSERFKLYDVEDGKITGEQVVDTNGSGHGALAGFLQAAKADALICGGIGMGAQMALADAGIKLYAGVRGSADAAAKSLASGTLEYDPDAHCDHHGHHHDGDCGHDHCADHHCRGN